MATTRRRRSIIARLVRSGPDGEGFHQPGGDRVVLAFNDRDTEALTAVLREHPQAWKTEMPWYQARQPNQQYCMAVKMAVALNWAGGLDVLLTHGADPDLSYEGHGQTALDLAVRQARPGLVKRLLQSSAHFEQPDGISSVRAMFGKEFSHARIDRCWKIMDTLVAAKMPVWTSGTGRYQKASAGIFLSLLDCFFHPDGGISQAIHLLEKFPVPLDQRPAVAKAIAGNLSAASHLWRRSYHPSSAAYHNSTIKQLFDAMSVQGVLPSPQAFVATAASQWNQDDSSGVCERACIQDLLVLRIGDCDPAAAASILQEFGPHPCLDGEPRALLSNLSLSNTAQPQPSAPRAGRF